MADRTSQADQEKQSSPSDPPSDITAVGESSAVDLVGSQPAEECPGCQSLDALALPCGHKLCPACIELSHGEMGPAGCTICYGSQLVDSVLHTLLDALFHGQPRRRGLMPGAEEASVRMAKDESSAGGGDCELCAQHGEQVSAFCLEEEEPVCQECQMDKHEDHRCCSIQEAVLVCKRQLRSDIRSLQEHLENISSVKRSWEAAAAHITSQTVTAAQILREEFEKMHQYLREEEIALMSDLKQEEEEKHQKMEDKINMISNDIRVLTSGIQEAEETMELDSFRFLKKYKKASERAQWRMEEPKDQSGALLDVAKHQGCMQHRVWDKMLRIIQYFPVTLDPNTASACLGVSPDLASVFVCEEQHLPDNPERFVSPQSILGSEGFSSGRHSWEVEVGDNSQWSIGVASETVHRNDWSDQSPSPTLDKDPGGGLWTLSLSCGEYRTFPGHSSPLTLRRRPRKVKVQLDWEKGCLTFSDASDNTLIYRFKRNWRSILTPYFSTTCSKHPLNIMAARVAVVIE